MAQYKASEEAKETVKVFDHLEDWLDIPPPERVLGTAIPTEEPDDAWGRPLPITFEVPDQPIDLDLVDAMRSSAAAESQGPAQAPRRSTPRQRSQSRQEGI